MASLTIEIPDDLMERLDPIRDQLPELLRRCLQPDLLSAPVYRYILSFLTSQPTPDQIAAFRPTPAMQSRHGLLDSSETTPFLLSALFALNERAALPLRAMVLI
ncbi:MAG: hypothetical protein HC910_06010 [Spirulinaceae cyanobacterium SM2_1_0]|nr:hypothetical protein [Spirulinaceae cyanobacterium SM2_1_0]